MPPVPQKGSSRVPPGGIRARFTAARARAGGRETGLKWGRNLTARRFREDRSWIWAVIPHRTETAVPGADPGGSRKNSGISTSGRSRETARGMWCPRSLTAAQTSRPGKGPPIFLGVMRKVRAPGRCSRIRETRPAVTCGGRMQACQDGDEGAGIDGDENEGAGTDGDEDAGTEKDEGTETDGDERAGTDGDEGAGPGGVEAVGTDGDEGMDADGDGVAGTDGDEGMDADGDGVAGTEEVEGADTMGFGGGVHPGDGGAGADPERDGGGGRVRPGGPAGGICRGTGPKRWVRETHRTMAHRDTAVPKAAGSEHSMMKTRPTARMTRNPHPWLEHAARSSSRGRDGWSPVNSTMYVSIYFTIFFTMDFTVSPTVHVTFNRSSSHVPSDHEAMYSRWMSDRVSIVMPMASSAHRATRSSISCGT